MFYILLHSWAYPGYNAGVHIGGFRNFIKGGRARRSGERMFPSGVQGQSPDGGSVDFLEDSMGRGFEV